MHIKLNSYDWRPYSTIKQGFEIKTQILLSVRKHIHFLVLYLILYCRTGIKSRKINISDFFFCLNKKFEEKLIHRRKCIFHVYLFTVPILELICCSILTDNKLISIIFTTVIDSVELNKQKNILTQLSVFFCLLNKKMVAIINIRILTHEIFL